MKVILHSCGSEPTRLARLEIAKTALELAGHEAQILTSGVGVPRSTWAAVPSAMFLSSARINDSLRADVGVPAYAGKTGRKRAELLALFVSFGVQVAPSVVVTSVDELMAKLAQFGDVAVWLKPQEALRVSDLRENNWDEIQSPKALAPVPVKRNHRRPLLVTLIKEDGTGKVDANAYANAADGDAYHDGHLYASAWTAAVTASKEAALVMATRLIDSQFQFGGSKSNDAQALQWPREDCRDPDGADFLAGNVVPKSVVAATCEMARELLIADRTAAPAGEGLKYQNVGPNQTGYDKTDTRPIISQVAQAMLAKFGTLLKSKSGAVRLVRS